MQKRGKAAGPSNPAEHVSVDMDRQQSHINLKVAICGTTCAYLGFNLMQRQSVLLEIRLLSQEPPVKTLLLLRSFISSIRGSILDQIFKGLFVMPRNHLTPGGSFQLFQTLRALEPSWMISCKPALRDSITPVFNDMAVVTDKEESTTIRHVDLHTNESISMARQMMQCDSLAEVDGPVVESLPIEAEFEIMLKINANVGSRCDGPEGGFQLFVVDPNLDILSVQEHIQASCMI